MSFRVDNYTFGQDQIDLYLQAQFDKFIQTFDFKEMFEYMIGNLPVYTDNTAALAGGLRAGEAYKTATGEVRFTV